MENFLESTKNKKKRPSFSTRLLRRFHQRACACASARMLAGAEASRASHRFDWLPVNSEKRIRGQQLMAAHASRGGVESSRAVLQRRRGEGRSRPRTSEGFCLLRVRAEAWSLLRPSHDHSCEAQRRRARVRSRFVFFGARALCRRRAGWGGRGNGPMKGRSA